MNQRTQYVILKGSGGAGLGDRMCGLAMGILLANSTNRTLHVDWRDRAFQSQNRNIFPDLLNLIDVQFSEQLPIVRDVSPAIWRDHLDIELDQLRAIDLADRGITWTGAAPAWDRDEAITRYSAVVSKSEFTEQAIVVWSGASMRPLVERLQASGSLPEGRKPKDIMGDILRRHVRFHPVIRKRIENFASEHFAGRQVIGVHYRKTDEAAAVRTIPTHAQYIQATDRLLANTNTEAVIFLATDNRDVQDAYCKRYGVERVSFTSKWLPPAGDSIHKNADCPDGVQAARDALVDVGLLAGSGQLVLTGNSSFSMLADWFSEAEPHKRVSLFPKSGVVGKVRTVWDRVRRKLQNNHPKK